jgi:hypothetical protein
MLRNVPTGTSGFFGTMAVSTTFPERRTNLTWLPFWLVSTKPPASSRPNFDLDHANPHVEAGLDETAGRTNG